MNNSKTILSNPNSLIFKLSILSISLLAQIAPLLSAATPDLEKAFPNMSVSAIEQLSSLPNLSTCFLILFSTTIANKFGIKKTVMTGLLLFLIGGCLPAILNNYWAIFVCRLIMGAGFGLFNPFSVSIMYLFYKGDTLGDMLGYQNAAQNLGNAAFGVLMGILVLAGWRTAFLGFAITLIPLIMFGLWVKFPERVTQNKNEKAPKQKLNYKVFIIAILMMLSIALFMVMTIKLPSFVVVSKITNPSIASSILGVMALVSMLSSSIFGKVRKIFKDYIMGIALIGITISFLIVAFSHNIIVMIIGVLLGGWFFGWVFPQGFLLLGQVAEKNSENLSTSVVLLFVSFGAFLSPICTNGLAELLNMGTPAGVFTVSAYAIGILGVITLLLAKFGNLNNQKTK